MWCCFVRGLGLSNPSFFRLMAVSQRSRQPAQGTQAMVSPSRAAADAGILPSISPQRGVHSTPPTNKNTAGLGAPGDEKEFNKFWGIPDDSDINACAYRISSPLKLSYCAPLSYDSEIAKNSLAKRKKRDTIRRAVLQHEMRLLSDVIFEWYNVREQRVLEEDKFARISKILGGALGHPLSGALHEWLELTAHLKLMREKLTKFAHWFVMRGIATFFCRWQVLWAGCTDTRPVRKYGLRVVDYRKERTAKDQMSKFICSDRGRNYLISLAQASGDHFHEICRQQMIDLETLGQFTPEELNDAKGPKMPIHLASGLYNKIQTMLHPTYFRINTILEYNSMTRMFITQLEPLVEEYREMRRKNEHPLGKTSEELKVENMLKKAQDEIEEKMEQLRQAREGVGYNQIRVDARIKPSPTSEDVLRTLQVAATDEPSDTGWGRGYIFDFPDRMVGDLNLQEVWVDLVLPEGAAAFVFISNSKKVTGKPLYRSNVHKGRGMDEQQYRFQMSEKNHCMVSCDHAVIVRMTAPRVPSKYPFWKEYRRVRKLNNILTIKTVECSKSLVMVDSPKQVSMQFVFGWQTGQEELEADPSKRVKLASPHTAETPMTPQTQTRDTGGTGDRSRPETGRPITGKPGTGVPQREHGDDNLHDKRKALQSSKSVRFFNEEAQGNSESNCEQQAQKEREARKINKMRRSGTKTQLSRTRHFHGTRNMDKDMFMQRHANFACAFNAKFNEFWVMEDFPSPYIVCMDFQGKSLRKIANFQEFSPNCITIDTQGNMFASDSQMCFYKFQHSRYFHEVFRQSADRMIRMWEFRDAAIGQPCLRRKSFACGVAIDPRNEDILYAAFSKGPILMIHTTTAMLMGTIDPDPPFQCVSDMVCCSDVLVVGDSHHIKIFDLQGNQISVLGQLYNDPCLIWTGLELYVADKHSTLWHCYQPKLAHGIELAHQHERVFR